MSCADTGDRVSKLTSHDAPDHFRDTEEPDHGRDEVNTIEQFHASKGKPGKTQRDVHTYGR